MAGNGDVEACGPPVFQLSPCDTSGTSGLVLCRTERTIKTKSSPLESYTSVSINVTGLFKVEERHLLSDTEVVLREAKAEWQRPFRMTASTSLGLQDLEERIHLFCFSDAQPCRMTHNGRNGTDVNRGRAQ
ncbi:hypothetical protein FQN60_016257, partial [Etheostoma spectabile]